MADLLRLVEGTPQRLSAGMPELAGDHLNAARFLMSRGHLVRRSPELGRWFIWNGSHFEEDRLDRVLDWAADVIDALREWVTEAENADEFRRRSRHYEASAKAGRREGLLSIVGTYPDVVVGVEQLDAHPLLLACSNGTVELDTGVLRAANPADLLTRGVRVDFDPDAWSELLESFIDTTFNGDAELTYFVQRLLGYCITGVVSEHILPLFFGAGANGKSTLVGVVQDLLGDHAMTAPEGLVIVLDHQPHPERIASLRGRRLVVSNELEASARLAEVTVKMLTGGDTLTARELYGRRFNFRPSHKILLVTNHRPRVSGTDHAIWRRIRLVPFERIVPDDQQDAGLRRRLVEDHGAAVLAWLVQGAREWHRQGLGQAQAVTDATEHYRDAEDALGTFLAEHTIAVGRSKSKVGDLYERWREWCETAGERPGRKQDFSTALEDHGFDIETHQGGRYVLGLGILHDGEVS